MRRTALWTAATVLALAGGLFAIGFAGQDRTDCPGRIICPVTGKEVCKDRCALVDPNRPDCPGKVECPLTGELVCRDRCPVNSKARGEAVPSCCRGTE